MIKFLTICIMIQCAAACSVLSAGTTTVLAFGDSITERQDSYRSFLVPALASKGLAVEFVGPKREAHVPVQLEIYERGGHMAFNFLSPNAADWPQRFRHWIQQFNFQSNR